MSLSTTPPRHDLLAMLGIATPIIQAPMAGTATPALAAAVSNAGGLGSLGLAAMTPQQAREAIRETRSLTDKPFNVNVFCHALAVADPAREARWLAWLAPSFAEFGAQPPAALRDIYTSFLANDAMLTVLLEEKPAVVSCHFGLPHASQVSALREAGIVLVGSATSLAEEAGVAAAGFDAVVAQGVEAGGHRGGFDPSHPDDSLGTMALVRLLVRHGSLPVIAAGGIMDGAGIAAALALGAQAAQLGTAFVSCPESAADAAYRAALLDERALHTVVTSAISGRPARGIANRLTALGEAAGAPPHAGYPMTYDAGKALHAAAKAKGNVAFAAQWAGQAAALSRPMGAAQLVATLMRETDEALAELHARLAALPGHRLNPQP